MKDKILRKSFRGYNKKDVNNFLAEMNKDMEEYRLECESKMDTLTESLNSEIEKSTYFIEENKTIKIQLDSLAQVISSLEIALEQSKNNANPYDSDLNEIIKEQNARIEDLNQRVKQVDDLISEKRKLIEKVNTLSESIVKREEDFYIQKQRMLASILEQTQYKQQAEQKIHELEKRINFGM